MSGSPEERLLRRLGAETRRRASGRTSESASPPRPGRALAKAGVSPKKPLTERVSMDFDETGGHRDEPGIRGAVPSTRGPARG